MNPSFALRCLCLVALLWLAGCAGMPERLQPGTTRAQVIDQLGPPSAEYALSGGARLQYSRQPLGRQVYNLDFDADGRLRSVVQVLDIHWMQKNIAIDRWTRDDVLRHMGRPALVERVALFDGDIWTYRYSENNTDRLAHVHIDRAGVVRKLIFLDEYSPPPDRS
ncbi:MAG TPA: hypothetical protein VLG41_22790 [Hydrogenophaga sp.]|uniref:outer membrane protein assembly factor BamE domain-containing protein n=1 Tax=Hydrogenophaga sp. TaxID=1904254 RepID=UPI002B7769EE|nr:hypothetical protein [Hydrogenophaga sp.]HSX95774.1 hypothetical protein [Hydrogenophaga sp.]